MSWSREFNQVTIVNGGPVLVQGTTTQDSLKSDDPADCIDVAIVKHGSGAVMTTIYGPFLSGWEARFDDGVSFPGPDGSSTPLAPEDEVIVVGMAHEGYELVVWQDTITVGTAFVEKQ